MEEYLHKLAEELNQLPRHESLGNRERIITQSPDEAARDLLEKLIEDAKLSNDETASDKVKRILSKAAIPDVSLVFSRNTKQIFRN